MKPAQESALLTKDQLFVAKIPVHEPIQETEKPPKESAGPPPPYTEISGTHLCPLKPLRAQLDPPQESAEPAP